METLKTIRTRRSIRRFKATPVPEKDVFTMLEAATMAPSGANRQPWKFLVVKSRKWKEDMVQVIKDSCSTLPALLEGVVENPAHLSEMMKKRFYVVSLFFVDAPLVFIVCVEREETPLWKCYTKQGMDRYDAFRKFGYVDLLSVSAAIENLLLTAHDLGYGACWMNIPFMAKDALEDLFSISYPWEILAMIPVGIPAHNPTAPKRKNLEEVAVFIDD